VCVCYVCMYVFVFLMYGINEKTNEVKGFTHRDRSLLRSLLFYPIKLSEISRRK
jgi:hypothetical protein